MGGQVYPSGEKSNNNVYVATASGKISEIERAEKGNKIKIEDTTGKSVIETLPPGLELIVKENDIVRKDQPLTLDPNVGGFGQTDKEIVLQNPKRIYGYLALLLQQCLHKFFL